MASTSKLSVLALVIAACASPPSTQNCATGIECPSDKFCAAVQPVCLETKCGDGQMDPGEECDDGNILDGDSCSHDCRVEQCGNNTLDPGEVCDDGNTFNGKCEGTDTGCDADSDCSGVKCKPDDCSKDCQSKQVCGNHIKDLGEACDDGNTIDADGCNATCTSTELCGNGTVDMEVGEVCDPPNVGGCSADCRSNGSCGNGTIDTVFGEECDDGLANNGDDKDCRSDCKINRCGDGRPNLNGTKHHEDCDGGMKRADGDGTAIPVQTADCNLDCSAARCGDGKPNVLNTLAPATSKGEQCDDGNTMNGDGCDNNCLPSFCGNGITAGGEECDDNNLMDGDGCDSNCKTTRCGNGIVTGTEQCDDGNTTSGDGCSATCVREFCGDGITNNITEDCDTTTISATCNGDCTLPHCGDGKVNSFFVPMGAPGGEQCDDHNTDDNDGCSHLCQFEFCGDNIKNGTEDCDTAGDSSTCGRDCKTPRCGDGKVNHSFTPMGAPGPEQCDDNNTIDGDGCSSDCQFERCGNHIIDPGEECDGSPVGGFTCAADCHLQKCGNGIIDPGEQCDDNNTSANDDCISNDPTPTSCKANVCGDGVLDMTGKHPEQCDHGINNGTPGDTCSSTCHNVTCGNGIVEQGETCDDGPGQNGAHKPCNALCQRNTCGDHDILTGIEQCDNGLSDTAGCDADCTFPVCGDNHLNTLAGEDCDHGPTNGAPGDTCDAFCHNVSCGNGIVDGTDQCDNGDPGHDSAACDSDCTAVFCGDGHLNTATEVCDQGSNNGNPCDYNLTNVGCTRCTSDCSALVSTTGPFCGDSVLNGPEVCDDGTRNGTQCAYNDFSCLNAATICNSTCTGRIGALNGPFCGDNVVQGAFNEQCDPGTGLSVTDSATCDSDCTEVLCGDGHKNAAAGEICDDHNVNACGSCSADCGTVQLGFATAQIVLAAPGPAFNNGETLTLDDGSHTPTVFEFRTSGSAGAGHVKIDVSSGSAATAIRSAINGVLAPLAITAGGSGNTVTLTNDRQTSLGNTAISETVADPLFQVTTPFTGGAGGDCPMGIGCASSNDCASGVCLANHKCM